MTKHSTTRKALGALLSVALTGLASFFATRNIEATTNPVQNALVVLVPTHGTITVTPTSNQGGTATITPSTGTAPSYIYDASPVTQVTVSVSNIDTGYRFTGWTIEKFGTPSTFTYPTTTQTTITMDANYQASANFAQQFTLTTSVASGNGSVAVNPTSSPSSPAGTYDSGTSVTLTATPASGWRFDHWHHEMFNTTPNPATITMDADKTWTAYFVQQYNLTTSVTGSGTITASPTSNPASSPVGTYDAGTGVTLTAAPATGWRFDHWSGDLTGSANPAPLTMGATKSITATFMQQFTITKTVAGTGCAIDADPPQNPSTSPAGTYDTGSTVSLTPQAAPGWRFGRWTTDGAWGGYANPLVFNNMTVNHSVIAYFAIPVTLPIVVSLVGAGSVTPSTSHSWNWEPGLYGKGVTVSLTAVPAEGYCFSHWEGGLAGSANPISYVVNTPTVTAVFLPKYTLTVSASDGGTVTPQSGPYCPGSIVSIAATPDTANGWRFLQWVGDTAGMADPTNPSNAVTVDTDKHISAVFAPEAPELVPDFDAMLTYFYDLNYDDTFAFIFPQDMGSSAEYDHNSWAPGGYYGTFSENDILDGAELALVEHVLENSADPHYEAVKSAWELNYVAIHERLAEIQAAYPGFDLPADGHVQVWAAYASIDADSQELVSLLFGLFAYHQGLNETLGVPLAVAAAPLAFDADYDADDKTNLAEWTAYHNGGGDFASNPQGWITEEPSAALSIRVVGNGAVTPVPSGPLYFPGVDVSLTATGDTGWAWRRWMGAVSDRTTQNTTVHIPHYGAHVTVQFAYRPGMNSLDFVGDWRDLLVYLGIFAQGNESYLTFDMGKIDNQDGVLVPVPNGIPDAAELALLQYVLQHSEAEYGSYGGVSHVTAWQAYADNLEQAQTDLAGHPDYAIRAVAAYMGLGTWGHQEAMVQLIQQHLQVSLDVHLYWGSGALAPERDADTDGASNLEEWEAGPPAGGGGQQAPPGPEQAAQSYGGASANAAVQSVIDPPPITDPEWEAALAGACTTCFVKLDVSPYDPTLEIRATPPGASSARELPKGVQVEVPVGTKIQVRILQAQDEFSHWFAPGTLINQSSWKEDDFIIAQDTVITPQYRLQECVVLEKDASGSLEFFPSGDRPVVWSVATVNGDDTAVTVLQDTVLELTAQPEGELSPAIVGENYGYTCWTYCESAVAGPGEVSAVRVASAGAGSGTASAALLGEHGTAEIGESFFQGVRPFVDTLWYPGPPENPPAAWFQSVSVEFKPYPGYYVHKYTGPLLGGAEGGTLEWAYLAGATLANPSPTYSAEVKDQTVITIVSECQDGCTGAYFGTVAVDPARRFYTPSLSIDEGEMEGATFERGEIVKIWAVPSCGYYHESWKIGGKRNVYRKKLLHFPEYPYRDHMDDLEILPPGDGRYTESQLYIEPLGENIQINATFACASTLSSIEQIRFTNDYNVVFRDDGTFGSVGAQYTEPEYVAGEGEPAPILCKMNDLEGEPERMTAAVTVQITPEGLPFTLIGESGDDAFSFVGYGESSGLPQEVPVTGQAPLDHAISGDDHEIHWHLEFAYCSPNEDLGTTTHKIYVTYGPPDVPAMVYRGYPWLHSQEATPTRLDFLVDAVKNKNCDAYKDVGRAMADAMALGVTLGTPLLPSTNNDDWCLWALLDSRQFECFTGRQLGVAGLTMLGFGSSKLRWECSQGCQAYPSTDHTSGPLYSSNCVDVEEPEAMCEAPECTLEPGPHPAHDLVQHAGQPFDDGIGGCPPESYWQLRFGGGGTGELEGSTAENFFKIWDKQSNEWHYVAVIFPAGPFMGSDNPGDEKDRAGRYQMMRAAESADSTEPAGQHWGKIMFPATDLP